MEVAVSAYDQYPLGLRLSHLALLRNLDTFGRKPDGEATTMSDDLAAFVRRYVDFLVVHHRSEEDDLLPALRRHTAGRTTDAAHLTRWQEEHRDIDRLGEDLGRAADARDRGALARVSADLRALLAPHVADEEAVLTPDHLREMLPEPELAGVMAAAARANRRHALAMASFLAHSLDRDEQRQLFGATPWLFRRVLLGAIGERRFARFRPYAYAPLAV